MAVTALLRFPMQYRERFPSISNPEVVSRWVLYVFASASIPEHDDHTLIDSRNTSHLNFAHPNSSTAPSSLWAAERRWLSTSH